MRHPRGEECAATGFASVRVTGSPRRPRADGAGRSTLRSGTAQVTPPAFRSPVPDQDGADAQGFFSPN